MTHRTYAAALAVVAGLVSTVGCGGPARFVSSGPPTGIAVDGWFRSPVPAVRAALAVAMERQGMTVEARSGSRTAVVAVKRQLPYVDEASGAPARGPLPAYVLRAELARSGSLTHVRLTVSADCEACDGTTRYEWEHPDDVAASALRAAARLLGERRARFSHPDRPRPLP